MDATRVGKNHGGHCHQPRELSIAEWFRHNHVGEAIQRRQNCIADGRVFMDGKNDSYLWLASSDFGYGVADATHCGPLILASMGSDQKDFAVVQCQSTEANIFKRDVLIHGFHQGVYDCVSCDHYG